MAVSTRTSSSGLPSAQWNAAAAIRQREPTNIAEDLQHAKDPVELPGQGLRPRSDPPFQPRDLSLQARDSGGPPLVLTAVGTTMARMPRGAGFEVLGPGQGPAIDHPPPRLRRPDVQRDEPGGQVAAVSGAPGAPGPRQRDPGQRLRRLVEVVGRGPEVPAA